MKAAKRKKPLKLVKKKEHNISLGYHTFRLKFILYFKKIEKKQEIEKNGKGKIKNRKEFQFLKDCKIHCFTQKCKNFYDGFVELSERQWNKMVTVLFKS